ncbi:hypothetical protein F7734_23275 [Scytonema sp. UIC 10036]|nr:hypothetical protein [Scytonema sp. UIC 10036]
MLLKVWDKFLEVSSAASRAILEQFVSHIDIVGEELLVTTTAQPKMYQNLILPKIKASKPRLQNLVLQYGYWVDAVSCNTKLGMFK